MSESGKPTAGLRLFLLLLFPFITFHDQPGSTSQLVLWASIGLIGIAFFRLRQLKVTRETSVVVVLRDWFRNAELTREDGARRRICWSGVVTWVTHLLSLFYLGVGVLALAGVPARGFTPMLLIPSALVMVVGVISVALFHSIRADSVAGNRLVEGKTESREQKAEANAAGRSRPMKRGAVASVLVGLLGGVATFLLLVPMSTATGMVEIHSPTAEAQLIRTAIETAKRKHVAAMQGQATLEAAAKELRKQSGRTLDETHLKVEGIPDTRLILVRYRDSDPAFAVSAVTAIIDCYRSATAGSGEIVEVYAQPTALPVHAVRASCVLASVFAAIATGLLAAGIGRIWRGSADADRSPKSRVDAGGDMAEAQGMARWVGAIPTILFHVLVGFVVLAFYTWVVPRLEYTFQAFHADLPKVAKMTLETSHWINDSGRLLVGLLGVMLGLDIGVCLALQALGRRGGVRWPARLWSLTVPFLLVAVPVLGSFSLLTAAVSIIQSVAPRPAVTTTRAVPDSTAAMGEETGMQATLPQIIPADVPMTPGQTGEYYVSGKIARPGMYSMTGHIITLKQAIVSAGFDATADLAGWKVVLVRRVEKNGEKQVAIPLDELFAGRVADRYLQPNDVLSVQAPSTTQAASK